MKKKNNFKLTSLPNIGKVISQKLSAIGIITSEEFLDQDPFDIFDKLLTIDPTLCRCALASIVGAHLGVKWHTITKQTAAEYQLRHPEFKWEKC